MNSNFYSFFQHNSSFFNFLFIFPLLIFLFFSSYSDSLSNCVQCWSTCKIIGGWRLSPFYIAFGIALIFWPHNLWLSYVAGIQLIILAILRLCTLFRFSGNIKSEGLLPQRDDNFDK